MVRRGIEHRTPVRSDLWGIHTLTTAGIRQVRHINHSLDVVRGVAALLVVVSHARLYSLTATGTPLNSLPSWAQLLLAPTGFGREAVAIFFVLSGFLVGGQVVRLVKAGKFDAVDYGVKRLSRLWSVLIPGLIFTAAFDIVIRSILPGNLRLLDIADDNPLTALCNAAFLMPTRCLAYGTDESLWSLGYEFWFYILFAAVAVGGSFFLRKKWLAGAIATAVGLACVLLFGIELLALIPAWLVGVGVAAVVSMRSRSIQHRAMAITLALALALVGIVAPSFLHVVEPIKFAIIGLTTAPLIGILALTDPAPRRSRRLFMSLAWIGEWSFSIYVFHLPIVKLFALLLPDAPPPLLLVMIYATAAIAVAATYPLFLISEKRMGAWRTAMFAIVGRRGAKASVQS
ncbi:acyltransferase [Herbiconiux sp. 11R-BC]|uniref:acyltransferase family protein n=1 Tax=Herbiconiux sp. 11R-BC TaxID=3111637 RepID=UPI003C11CBA4